MRIFLTSLLFFATLAFLETNILASQLPANPYATQAAKNVLKYLYELPAKTQNKVVSGQSYHYSMSRNEEEYDMYITAIYDQTGQYPGLVGTDLMFGPPDGPYPSNWANARLIDCWNKGNLVTLSWHMTNPVKLTDAKDRQINFSNIYVEGTPENIAWKAQLDMAANALAELRDAGVVVLWRPMHEMPALWWWGQRPDFAKAWQYMFNYFTYTKNLNNLLWVYSSSNKENNVDAIMLYYPGDSYVDVVGMSIYVNDIYDNNIPFYDMLRATGKPFAMSELGLGKNETRPVDYYRIITRIKNNYPNTAYFFCWGGEWAIANNAKAYELMNDPWIANRGEISYSTSPQQDSTAPAINSLLLYRNTATQSLIEWSVSDTGGSHLASIKVFRALDSNGTPAATWRELTNEEVVFATNVDTDARTIDDGVSATGIYWYKIKVSDKAGNAKESAAVMVDLTVAYAPPAAPGGLAVK